LARAWFLVAEFRARTRREKLGGFEDHRLEKSVRRISSMGNIANVAMKVYLRRLAIRLCSSSQAVLQKSLLIGIGVEHMAQWRCFTMTGGASF